MNLQQTMDFMKANTWAVFAVTCWVIANVAPRPHPEQQENRWLRVFWTLIDRISLLTAETVPGRIKWIFAASPLPAVADRITHPDLEPVVVTSDEETDKPPPEKRSP